MKTSAEIRQAFLDYFAEKGHQVVPSSSLVPEDDPSLLFTNAGMVQFKHVLTGVEKRPYQRAVSSQRCVRAGGKHNDLENVGYTARHLTFFEMLGNFSFGDYFKKDAIIYAWDFLTNWAGLPAEKLWVTVYEDDDEAAEVWLNDIGISAERFSRIGDKPGKAKYESDNFWAMGNTGPCGPCSEIFYDHGEQVWGGPPGSAEEDGDRYIEIWNLVFMQYERSADGTLTPLPKPSVDTGMGLERLAAVLQRVHSNYDIDLFQHLIKAAARVTNTDDLESKSLRVIADHIRSAAFLILDHVFPANEGRGYVLRRIIRRAIRHGYQLGQTEPFFYQLVDALNEIMGQAYSELGEQAEAIRKVLYREEERFSETIEQGMSILRSEIQNLSGSEIPGDIVFKLYDTYGFPVDLTADIAREQNLTIDEQGFENEMQAQRERARAASQFGNDQQGLMLEGETCFSGYDKLSDQSSITSLYQNGEKIEEIQVGDQAIVIVDRTPFYAESGGQVGDRGLLVSENGSLFNVQDTQKQGESVIGHIGICQTGSFRLGDKVEARVNPQLRQSIRLNHSATHLLHAALRELLGSHVQQKGSLVDSEKLRFDFSHYKPVSQNKLAEIERLVNRQIRHNDQSETKIMPFDKAKESGAVALFGEKYADDVRVLSLGQFSVELCGGTHVQATGDIGLFKIVSETGIASGVRRIEAVTGEAAIELVEKDQHTLHELADKLKTNKDKVISKMEQLQNKHRELEKKLDVLKSKIAASAGGELLDQVVEVEGINTLAARLEGADNKTLRETMDKLKDKLGSGIILLATVDGPKVSLIAGVTRDLTQKYKAGDLIKHAAAFVNGKGGGRADMAQAGGNDPAGIPKALESVKSWILKN